MSCQGEYYHSKWWVRKDPIPESFEQQSFQSLKTIVSTNICVTPVRYLFEAFPLHGIDRALGSDGNPGTFNLAQWVKLVTRISRQTPCHAWKSKFYFGISGFYCPLKGVEVVASNMFIFQLKHPKGFLWDLWGTTL